MAIHEIRVHEYMQKLANYDVYSSQIKNLIKQHMPSADVSLAEVYYMDGDVTNPVVSGSNDRLVILLNYPLEYDGATKVRDNEGNLVATHIETHDVSNQINIFPDLFNEHTQENIDKFADVLKLIETQVFLQKILDYSWKSTSKKEELTKEFTDAIVRQQGKFMRDDQAKANRMEEEIREYTRMIKANYETRIRLLNQIESAQAKLNSVGEKLIKDLDNIIAHPKVKELFIRDGKFIVHTNPLYAYHDKSGDRYYIGNMRIEMNPQNTDVKFFGDNPRKSHWTQSDPHPHVNGRNGQACLGNVAPMIAELSAQMELYALTLVGIDFLESVNTSDPAGKNIVNWDRVDEEGNILEPIIDEDELGDDPWTCGHCEDQFHENTEDFRVYTSYEGGSDGNGTWGAEMYVCEDCRDNHYTYHEELDEFIRDGECVFIDDEEDEEDEF